MRRLSLEMQDCLAFLSLLFFFNQSTTDTVFCFPHNCLSISRSPFWIHSDDIFSTGSWKANGRPAHYTTSVPVEVSFRQVLLLPLARVWPPRDIPERLPAKTGALAVYAVVIVRWWCFFFLLCCRRKTLWAFLCFLLLLSSERIKKMAPIRAGWCIMWLVWMQKSPAMHAGNMKWSEQMQATIKENERFGKKETSKDITCARPVYRKSHQSKIY